MVLHHNTILNGMRQVNNSQAKYMVLHHNTILNWMRQVNNSQVNNSQVNNEEKGNQTMKIIKGNLTMINRHGEKGNNQQM